MNLTRCNQGHFYDADKYSSCPHCNNQAPATGGPNSPTVGRMPAGQGATEKVDVISKQSNPQTDSDNAKSDSLQGAVDDVQKTIGIFNTGKGKEPVVGWLVCIDGSSYGEDFKLRMGRNFIGRNKNMDVVLASDSSVSRDKHAIIVYDPKENMFIMQAGASKELSYLNDKVVLSPQELKAYDIIKLGATTLMFIPFCSDKFVWKTEEK